MTILCTSSVEIHLAAVVEVGGFGAGVVAGQLLRAIEGPAVF
jgi:hypothetical protein